MTTNPRIIIAGGNGFLGRALTNHFQKLGCEVTILTRAPATDPNFARQVAWDACSLGEWTRELEGAHTVINLAGRSVDCRYTSKNRRAIFNSRVNSTRAIGLAISKCKRPPPVWINASTATIYKHTLGPAWTESGEIAAAAEAKDQFSVEVATAWEQSLSEACVPQTRKIAMRTAMVFGLGRNSVFPALRRLVRLGLGGHMGTGKQFVSWIHERDFCRAVEWLINRRELSGPVNVCAPNPLTNAEMMKTFREVCSLPAGLPAPQWMLEIGAFFLRTETELIIKSRRVTPAKLIKSGFSFEFPLMRQTLHDMKARSEPQ